MIYSFRLPLRFLRGNAPRLALTVLALACGVALICAIDLVNRAVLAAFVEVVDTMAGRAALQVTADGAAFPESTAEAVAADADVELAVPVVGGTAFLTDGSGQLLTVHGVDVASDAAVRVYEARDAGGLAIDDPLVFLSQPDSVVLTRRFAERHGVQLGATLALDTPAGRRDLVVRGLLEASGIAQVYGGNLAVMDIAAAQAVFTQPGSINRVDVVVRRDADPAAVAARIAALLPPGLRVEAPAQRKVNLHAVMQSLRIMLQGVGLAGVIAAFLIVFNRLGTVYESRAWQLGILRAGGVRSAAVARELLKESALLGLAGVALGIPLGIVVGRAVLPIIATSAALTYQMVRTDADYVVSLGSLLLASAVGLGAALLAAGLPAWRATHLSVVQVLRRRGLAPTAETRRRRPLLGALALIGTAAAVAAQAWTQSAAWGLLATLLIALGTASAAAGLVRLLQLRGPARRLDRIGPATRLARTILCYNPRRSALTIGMIGVGLGASLWLWVVAKSFEHSVIDVLTGVVRADLVVSSANVASGFVEAPVRDTVLGDLRAVAGVAAVAGERVIDWHYDGGPITINAFDRGYLTDAAFGRWPLYGAHIADLWQQVADGHAVIASRNFVLNLAARVGDRLVLQTPRGPLSVVLGGVTMDFASPRGTLEMSRDLYRHHWYDDQVTRIFVRTAPGVPPAIVRDRIAAAHGAAYGLKLLSAGALIDYFAAQVRRAFAPLLVLAAMVLVVVLVGMADALAADVAERTRELGTIRAVGVRRGPLRRVVLAEAGLLGGLGLLLALAAGLALGILWVHSTFPYLLGWVLHLRIPYGPTLLIGLATAAVSVAAAWLPARRALHLDPAVALRDE